MDLEDVGRPQDEVEALVAGEAAGVVHQNDVVADPAVTDAPNRNRVELNTQAGVADGGDAGHDGLRHVLALKSRGEVATSMATLKR